jgi:hypothetical protein
MFYDYYIEQTFYCQFIFFYLQEEEMTAKSLSRFNGGVKIRRGMIFGIIIVTALIAFEAFNYTTTDFALTDLLGDLRFLGIRWAMILSLAFCGIDFAGIARLLTPGEGKDEPGEVWYLFGAWLLAATMNAMLTWWGVSIAILNHQTLGNAVIDQQTLLRAVPIFVAVLVWLIRVLIIGTLSVAGDNLFTQSDYTKKSYGESFSQTATSRSLNNRMLPSRQPTMAAPPPPYRPAPKVSSTPINEPTGNRPEPTYQSLNPSQSPNQRIGDPKTPVSYNSKSFSEKR